MDRWNVTVFQVFAQNVAIYANSHYLSLGKRSILCLPRPHRSRLLHRHLCHFQCNPPPSFTCRTRSNVCRFAPLQWIGVTASQSSAKSSGLKISLQDQFTLAVIPGTLMSGHVVGLPFFQSFSCSLQFDLLLFSIWIMQLWCLLESDCLHLFGGGRELGSIILDLGVILRLLLDSRLMRIGKRFVLMRSEIWSWEMDCYAY